MVIGFDNETLKPDLNNIPDNAESLFHVDKIQGLITKFSSEPFEISIKFPERDGQPYPVIVVPSGVRTPVASKSDLKDVDGKKFLICVNDIYIRSLRSNNTPSTTKAGWKDWPTITEFCFENREADIGRFFRRHLSGISPKFVREFAEELNLRNKAEPSIEESLLSFLNTNKLRYEAAVSEQEVQIPSAGTWETGLVISGEVNSFSLNTEFLNLLDSSNPSYTGWPIWLDSRNFGNHSHRPYVNKGVWESLIIHLDSAWGKKHLDFMTLDPKGKFYLRRLLEDDISDNNVSGPERLKFLDFSLPIVRSAEAIAVGVAFAKAMGCDPDNTSLNYIFRWSKLKKRELSFWANPARYISPGRYSHQDEIVSYVSVPLDSSLSSIGDFVTQAVRPLFEAFDGFVLSKQVIEDLSLRLIERRL